MTCPTTARLLAASLLLSLLGTAGVAPRAAAADRTWIGGNADWDALVANWNPADEPDADDTAIFTTPNTVDLANASESLAGLTLSGGIDLNLNGNDMLVDGFTTLSDAGTQLFIPTGSQLTTDQLDLNTGAAVRMQGGSIILIEESGAGLFTINGLLSGHGVINLNDGVAATTTLLLLSGGDLAVASTAPGDLFGTAAATMTINLADADGRVDLDNAGATVSIGRNDTLDINGEAHGAGDAYSGTLNLGEGATLDMSNAWAMDSGTINANTGGPVGGAGNAATITGGDFTMTGGTINLDAVDSLRFDLAYTASGGTISNSGRLVFSGTGSLNGADVQMLGADASITLEDNALVAITQGDFSLDGTGTATNVTTIGNAAILFVNMDFDSGAGDVLSHTIHLAGGELNFNNLDAGFAGSDTQWHLSNAQVTVMPGGTASALDGDRLLVQGTTSIDLAEDALLFLNTDDVTFVGNLASVNVGANATLELNADSTWDGGGLTVAAGGLARLDGVATFNNSASTFTGTGTLRMGRTDVFVNQAVTFDMAGGTVDLDWEDGSNAGTVFVNAPLTINAESIEAFGDGSEVIRIRNFIVGSAGSLIVNLDNPNDAWTVDPGGTLVLDSDGTAANILFGSDVNLHGTTEVIDTVGVAARINVGGTVNLGAAAGDTLTLFGGSFADPNTLDGGVVTGPGTLRAEVNRALHGHGNIQTFVEFFGNARLIAEGGSLTLHRPILDVGRIGTLDTGANPTLNIVLPWNTNVADEVLLQGGRLIGAAVTNDLPAGIRGFGLVTAEVQNNTQLAADGGTLFVVDADWDGAANNGALNALLGDLELTDPAGSFVFAGSVSVGDGREAFINGFDLVLLSQSSLSLSGGTYRSDVTQTMRGSVITNANPSTLDTDANIAPGAGFTLNGDLRLAGDTAVSAGATFAGGASLINLDTGLLTLADGVDVGVLLENRGTLVLGGSPGQTTGTDFEQSATGTWRVDIEGAGLNDFDRMNLTGAAALAGTLDLAVGGGYAPQLGDTFNILSANGGVVGAFDAIEQDPAMPNGTAFRVSYLPTLVQLEVVLAGDLNGDGYVGVEDLDILLANWGDTVTAGSMIDGDASGDGLVGQTDLAIVQAGWGGGTPPGGLVPEPGTAGLLALGGLAFSRRGRRG